MPNPWATCGHAPIAQQQGNSRTPSLNAAQGNSSSLSVAQVSQKVGHAALWDVVEKDQRWGKGRDQSGLVRNQYGNQKACTLLWLCPAPHQCVPGEVGAGSAKPGELDNQVPITNPSPSHLHYLPLVFLSPTSPLPFYSPSLSLSSLSFSNCLFFFSPGIIFLCLNLLEL